MSLRARNGAAAERGPMEGAAPPPGCSATWTEDGRRRERRWVKYDGIGPVDETGLPLASRSSVDRPRDWYRRMFQQIHGKLPEPEWDTPCCTADLQTSQPPLDPPALPNGSERTPWGDADGTAEPGGIFEYGGGTAPARRGQVAAHRGAPHSSVGSTHREPASPLQPPRAAPALQPIEVQLQRELEQLSAELDEDIRAMERLQQSPAARSARRASPTPTAPLSALSPHGLQGRPPAVPTGGSVEQSGREPPPPPALPIAADLGTPAAPARGAAQMAAARLKFDFRAESPRELSLRRGDVVLLHGAVDANWLRGEHGGRVGIFPRTYVEVLPPGEATQPGTPAAAQGCATAVFSFHGELPVELSFRRGEQLSLLRRIDAHWYEAQPVGAGRRGLAPRCFLCVHREPGGGPTAHQPPAPQVGAKQGPADPAGRPPSPRHQDLPPHAGPAAPNPSVGPQKQGRPDITPSMVPPISRPCALNGVAPHCPYRAAPYPVGAAPYRPIGAALRDLSLLPAQPPSAGGSAPHPQPTSPHLGSEIRWTPHRVLYDYRPQNGDELELREGERVDVLQCCDDGWFVGVSQRTQQFGTFPGNYVAPL
ncbi:vinexin [Tympanuchus pallidicinctus]|uniref:vinexin n=1 Tax=Tympanuchus pallidicinctus TaxID=109042 RepID=UPI0022874C65|nr:vinexin [Tympanuchus pallidicinctus]